MHRYYCEHPLNVDSEVTVEGDEAHHLARVMRAKVGQRIKLFNGQGSEFVAEIREVARKSTLVRIVEQITTDRELDFQLTVGSALPKGDRQKFLLEKLVELGVTNFVPLQTERSVVKPSEAVCQRLRKAVIEASKQCGRNRLMEVSVGCRWQDYLKMKFCEPTARLIAHPYVTATLPAVPDFEQQSRKSVALAIGSEGGFSEHELQQAEEERWCPVSLGPRILRIETAAVALVARLTVE